MSLAAKRAWIFDLDGTLTVGIHDFDAIRVELDLPAGQPILEALDALPEDEAAARHGRLMVIERELALASRPSLGAAALLERLTEAGAHLGIVTRNSAELALLTLEACDLADHFEAQHVLGRESAPPKPDPTALRWLLESFGVGPGEAVMVGDFAFDLQAGRAAGVSTVWVAAETDERFGDLCDARVPDLATLARRLDA
jgi:HAD superfamily hydrolase (TIGR01509 family)